VRSTKITKVDTFLVGGDRWGWVVVRVETDEGICGLGEGSLEGREQSVLAAVAELSRYLVGRNAGEIEKHYFALFRDAVWTGGAVLQSAISAVEMALWDIKGKLLGVPIYEFLGGKVRDRLELYANGWWYKGGSRC
jgi:galactonate dehydratase